MPWAKLKLRPYAPCALTSRIIGLPATCRNVVPTPRRKMHASNTVNVGGCSEGMRQATAFSPKPSNSSFFFPTRAANKPPGTLNTAKAINTKKDSIVDITLLSW